MDTEKLPTNRAAFRYERAANWPQLPLATSQSAWQRGRVLVTSSVGGMGNEGLSVFHIAISHNGRKPDSAHCARVLADFDCVGAAELQLSGDIGRARHFELATSAPADLRPACEKCAALPWTVGDLGPGYQARITDGTGHHPRCPTRAN